MRYIASVSFGKDSLAMLLLLIEKKEPLDEVIFYDWNLTEKDCLLYCYEQGYFWLEDEIRLYDILDRVSCWCCANKNLKELKNYYKHLPKYWNKLKQFQERTNRPFKNNKHTIFDLEERFKREEINQ